MWTRFKKTIKYNKIKISRYEDVIKYRETTFDWVLGSSSKGLVIPVINCNLDSIWWHLLSHFIYPNGIQENFSDILMCFNFLSYAFTKFEIS